MFPIYQNINFDSADFQGRCLAGIQFIECSIRFASFQDADLSQARFENCDLYQSSFNGACLYACWFTSSNLTKVNFNDALLSGVRFKSVDITKTRFGIENDLHLGAVRRTKIYNTELQSNELVCTLGSKLPNSIELVESSYSGIKCPQTFVSIDFSTDPEANQLHRRASRQAEVLSDLRLMQMSEGLFDDSLITHIAESRSRRKSISTSERFGRLRIWFDMLFNDGLWLYGTSFGRPLVLVIASWLICSTSALLLGCLGLRSGVTRIGDPDTILRWGGNWRDIAYVFYQFAMTPTGSGQFQAFGWGKALVAIYLFSVFILVALAFQAGLRKLSRT